MDRDCTISLHSSSNTRLFHAEKYLSWIQSEIFLLWFTTVVSCPTPMQHCAEPASIFWITSLQVEAGSYQVPVKMPLLHVEEVPLPQSPFTMQVLELPDELGGLPLTSLRFTNVFLMLGDGRHCWMWHCIRSLMNAEMDNHLLWSTGHTPINRSICDPTFLSQILRTCYISVQHCSL